MTGTRAAWRCDGQRASLTAPSWVIELDTLQPSRGLRGFADPLTKHGVLAVQLPDFPDPIRSDWLLDCYVRQPDLTVTYERPGSDHLRAQLDWRYVAHETTGGLVDSLHLLISLQTDRLDSRPLLHVTSTVSANTRYRSCEAESLPLVAESSQAEKNLDLGSTELWCAACDSDGRVNWQPVTGPAVPEHSALLFRDGASDRSLLQLAMPSDVLHFFVEYDPEHEQLNCAYELLGEHLEKGVIRRAQLAVCVIARHGDQQQATELLQQFVSAPPPLTV
jgi:hypothetical protein